MNEGGRRIHGPAARVTHTPQHGGDILREQERSNLADVAFMTARPDYPLVPARLLGPGGERAAPCPSLGERRQLREMEGG
jgi:hypothetical protein